MTPDDRRARHREYMRRWRAANGDKHRAWSRAWYDANHERALSHKRAYYEATIETRREKDRARSVEHNAQRKADPEYAIKNRATVGAYRAKVVSQRCKRHVECRRIPYRGVFERHGLTCWLCGASRPIGSLHVDHIIPISKGGPHCWLNLRPACPGCNSRKKNHVPAELPADLLAAWPEFATRLAA